MGHIKEPEGIDFIIEGRPLTKEEEIAISTYIRTYKEQHSKLTTIKTTISKKKKILV